MPILETTTQHLSNQVPIPNDVTVTPPHKGSKGMTRILISAEAAKLIPADTKIVSITEGGSPGIVSVLLEGEKKRVPYIQIPPDIEQHIDFDYDDEADFEGFLRKA